MRKTKEKKGCRWSQKTEGKKGCRCHQREREVNRINRSNMSSSRSYVPQDLLEDILKRLPVKSILRFKCVNKSWFTLFHNPTFIAKHYSYSLSQNSPSLIVEGCQSHCHKHYYTEDNGRLPFGSSFMAIYLHPHSDDEEYGFDPGLNLDFPVFSFFFQSISSTEKFVIA